MIARLPSKRSSRLARIALLGMVEVGIAQPALACVPEPPPAYQPGETEEAYNARVQVLDAAKEKEREAYNRLPQREKNRREQVLLWDGYEMVFLARVERVKINGKIYPRPVPKTPPKRVDKNGRLLPPLVPPPEVPLMIGLDSHRAFIRPIRWIKGAQHFAPSWHYVGGRTSCGTIAEGALAYTYPGSTVIVYANRAFDISTKGDKVIETPSFSLHGIPTRDAADPRLKPKR